MSQDCDTRNMEGSPKDVTEFGGVGIDHKESQGGEIPSAGSESLTFYPDRTLRIRLA